MSCIGKIERDDDLKPINFLTKKEIFILNAVQEDIKRCKTNKDLQLLENTLDRLLKKTIERYKKAIC